jgi:hypothetical protein
MVMTRILLILALALIGGTAAADTCECQTSTDINPYAKMMKASDVVFVGRVVDILRITPLEYVAVFEEQKLLKGKASNIGYGSTPLRYVLASGIEGDCSFRFRGSYEQYVVFAGSKSEHLLYSKRCSGTSLYNPMIGAQLRVLESDVTKS